MTINDQALADLAEGQIESALSVLREEAWRNPTYQSLCNLATAERAAGEFDAAALYLAKAISFNPQSPVAWYNWANLETEIGNFDSALNLYSRAWELGRITISAPQIALGYAQALLRERRFAEAWPFWELGRIGRSWFPLPGTIPWHPTHAPGHVLVVCEGGYGDAFLYSRWLPFVKQAGAREVTLMIWRSLIDWTDWSALGVNHVVAKEDEIEPGEIDYTTSWMSLPVLAGVRSMADLPWPKQGWNKRVKVGGMCKHSVLRIGYCWRAEELGQLRKFRSLDSDTAQAVAAFIAGGGEEISLIPGEGKGNLPARCSWSDTQRLIQSLDFVITVDTAVAHLSALCGIPTLILLPANSDWKWGRNSLIDEWYGPHVRYFRNSDPLKWDTVGIGKAIEELCTTPR
jgi:hypothetical protein